MTMANDHMQNVKSDATMASTIHQQEDVTTGIANQNVDDCLDLEDDFVMDEDRKEKLDGENTETVGRLRCPSCFGADDKSEFPFPVGDVTCWKASRSPADFLRLSCGWLLLNKSQILSGLTVALAQVPEAVSFSFIAGVDPIVGLTSAWIMGLCTSWVGGRPGMVAGATGAVSIVLTSLIKDEGIGTMFYAIMLAGILQMIFGILRLGAVMRMVPHPVMVGVCNGLGVIIAFAQFSTFKVPVSQLQQQADRRLSGGVHLFGFLDPFTDGRPWVPAEMAGWMIFHVVITISVYITFPKFTKVIPGSLAGIVVSTILEWALIRPAGYQTNTVKDMASVNGKFPVPVWFDETYGYRDILPEFNGQLIAKILPTAITAAVIGLLESLLTLQIIDELTNTKGSSRREAFGQGLGQFLSAMFGGMGGCTTMGQSLMNIHSGGFTRLSSSAAAIFMLIIVLTAYRLINLIPVASLTGVMLLVAYFTIEWESFIVVLGSALPERFRKRWGIHTKVKRSNVFVMLSVVAVTLVLNLAFAVGCGIILSSLIFAWDAGTRIIVSRSLRNDGEAAVYEVSGPIFFGSVKTLMDQFGDLSENPSEVAVLLEDAEIYDWSGMVAIRTLHDRFKSAGSTVHFQKLTVESRLLMMKSKHLWEGVHVFDENHMEDLDHEIQDPHCSPIHANNALNAHF